MELISVIHFSNSVFPPFLSPLHFFSFFFCCWASPSYSPHTGTALYCNKSFWRTPLLVCLVYKLVFPWQQKISLAKSRTNSANGRVHVGMPETENPASWVGFSTHMVENNNNYYLNIQTKSKSQAAQGKEARQDWPEFFPLFRQYFLLSALFLVKSTKPLWWGGGGTKTKKSSGTGLTHMHLCEHPERTGKDNTTLGLLASSSSEM